MQERNRGNILLLELVFAVLFFALVAVTVTQMFVASTAISRKSGRTQAALAYAQDAAEMLTGHPAPEQFLLEDGFQALGGGVYEKASQDSDYRIRVTLTETATSALGRLLAGQVGVYPGGEASETPVDDEALVQLPLSSYIPYEEAVP